MMLTSVYVELTHESNISVGVIADRIGQYVGGNITRVDVVHGSHCFVHFDRNMPEVIWDVLNYGEETEEDPHGPITLDTPEGPIRVGLNISNGLDPTTEEDIMQYILNDHGFYSRDFKTRIVRKWSVEEMFWDNTVENPFVPAEYENVEMVDASQS